MTVIESRLDSNQAELLKAPGHRAVTQRFPFILIDKTNVYTFGTTLCETCTQIRTDL